MDLKELRSRVIKGKEYTYLDIKDENGSYRTDFFIKLKVTDELKEIFSNSYRIDKLVVNDLKRNELYAITIMVFTEGPMDYITRLFYEKEGEVMGSRLTVSSSFSKYMQHIIMANRNNLVIEAEGSCLDYLDDENYGGALTNYYSPKSTSDIGLYYQGKDLAYGKSYKITNFNLSEAVNISENIEKVCAESDITGLVIELKDGIDVFNMLGHISYQHANGEYYTDVEHLLNDEPEWCGKTLEDYKNYWELDLCHKRALIINSYYKRLMRKELDKEAFRVSLNNYMLDSNEHLESDFAWLVKESKIPYRNMLSKKTLLGLLALPNIVVEEI